MLLQDRLSRQFALPPDQRMQLHGFDYHWWRPVTAPGKIKPGLVIPWHRPKEFDYQQQSDVFNQSGDESALRESAWQGRRAVAQRLCLAFARAPRLRMPTRLALSAARSATLQQIRRLRASRCRTNTPGEWQPI
jgi:hypothetical protein